MDENTWRLAQFFMWIIGIQTSFLAALIGIVWKNLNKKFDKVDHRFEIVDHKFEKIQEELREIRKDISKIEVETAVITATLRFNGFDLDRHKAQGEE